MAAPNDPYAQLDEAIESCVRSQGSVLFREWADKPARFFYLPGDPPFECFQININLIRDGSIAVLARAIDTNDDTEDEMEWCWQGEFEDLPRMLTAAVDVIGLWKRRLRKQPDPPSPW